MSDDDQSRDPILWQTLRMLEKDGWGELTIREFENTMLLGTLAILEEQDSVHWRGFQEMMIASKMPKIKWMIPEYNDALFQGPLGELTLALDRYTEASPIGVFASLLTMFGNALGTDRYTSIDGITPSMPRLFTVLVGDTSLGRKGTATNLARDVLARLDIDWSETRVAEGLSSGEGLIAMVRDPEYDEEGNCVNGSEDRRLLALETEWGGLLETASRPGNVVSAKLRQAFDGHGNISTMTKIPMRARRTHISVLGHVTPYELRKNLGETDIGNGFANRHLLVAVHRSKVLDEQPPIPWGERPLSRILAHLERIKEHRSDFSGRISRESNDVWMEIRTEFDGRREHMDETMQSLVARAEEQVMRIALILALAEGTQLIHNDHLLAALYLVRYSWESLLQLFDLHWSGDAYKLYQAVYATGAQGLARDAQINLFGNHKPVMRATAARQQLIEHKACYEIKVYGRGRPAQHLIAVPFISDVPLNLTPPQQSQEDATEEE